MKKILFAFILFNVNACLSAQSPAIVAHSIVPTNPSSSSPIKIVTYIMTQNSSFLVDKQFTVTTLSQNIKLHLCYADGGLTMPTPQVDTFAVGQLPPGTYTVQLRAYMSNAGQHCAKVDSNFASFTFIVAGNVGLETNFRTGKTKLFPNPAHDYLTVEAADRNAVIRIFTVEGQLMKTSDMSTDKKISLQELSFGIYLLEIISSEGKEVHRLIIE